MKRVFKLKLKSGDEVDLNIVKATAIRADVGMLHLDKIKNGEWRLIISDDVLSDISQLTSIEIIREDDPIKPPEYIKINDGVKNRYMRLINATSYKYIDDSTGWVTIIRYEGDKMYVVCPNVPSVHNTLADEINFDIWRQNQL